MFPSSLSVHRPIAVPLAEGRFQVHYQREIANGNPMATQGGWNLRCNLQIRLDLSQAPRGVATYDLGIIPA